MNKICKNFILIFSLFVFVGCSNEKEDKLKEKFAINNGYKFLRLTKKDILDPNTILKIKELL